MGVWAVSLTTALMFPCHSNDSFEGEPEEKRRKTTNVIIEQPATDSKVLIDNVPDNSNLFEEVWDTHTCLFFSSTHWAVDIQLSAVSVLYIYIYLYLLFFLFFTDSGMAPGKLLWWTVQWPLQPLVGGTEKALNRIKQL